MINILLIVWIWYTLTFIMLAPYIYHHSAWFNKYCYVDCMAIGAVFLFMYTLLLLCYGPKIPDRIL